MSNRSRYQPPVKMPAENKPKENRQEKTEPKKTEAEKKQDSLDGILSRLNIPLLNNIKSDGDTALIIGLLLLLTAEKSDRLLLLALMYILM